ncbi:hypothetical protein TSOC_004826 [Tetrabaena socialis]|uniref:LamG-like jellyroll fold domain-containing protein n=1 Tax=Tetrabaena socialis TaxID=47790 RepID=A0A2J8A7T7_9CHLO|nr:hypothetical protein TSOC_004826 [Tetrabaena socialis]|eukprot:PNH08594.1 hypothetical protein TSOC_004826 [Tetrabaena socialis]
MDSPMKLYDMNKQVRIEKDKIPPTVNGQEFSASFWLYLVEFQPTRDGPQLIFMRGADTTTVGTANPIVALDGQTNRLYISARTSTSLIATPANFYLPASNYLTATIDYFPLQRWVNVAMVIKDDAMNVYLNGSLYTVANVSDLVASSSSSSSSALSLRDRPIFAACTGNLVVGPKGVDKVRDPRAYLAQFRFYNYALTQKDINGVYAAGPSATSLLARLGLAGYGMRTPIYRIEV